MKKKLVKFISIFSFITLSPLLAFAQTTTSTSVINGAAGQTCSNNGQIGYIICQAQNILNSLLPLLVLLGLVYFIWGVITYVIAGGEEAKTKGRDRMIYGIIGFAVIVGLWGLVNIVVNTFGLSGAAPSFTINGGPGVGCTVGSTFATLLGFLTCLINSSVIPFIFSIAVVVFVWGVIQFFIINADEEAKREQGKQFMIWGIIALAVMLSVWGLVGILGKTFNVNTSVLPQAAPPTQ
ncbi:MAG: hypothetical protein P4L63_01650 [Candidatus Pacebacteria bacterium]|nr:hypothetical protein [Candidatus Paceibacterota bacterium]